MSHYVLSFRVPGDVTAGPDVEAEWGQWFGALGGTVVDFGNRVGEVEALGLKGDGQLAGYVVIEAADLPAAVAVAKGCPGLNYGGGVEVGSVVAM